MGRSSSQLTSLFRKAGALAAAAALCLALGGVSPLRAEKPAKSTRKVIYSVKPAYPQTLKNLHIEGLVRLKVTVSASGAVDNIDVIGGNPILVENAVKAVRSWKYAPAPTQTEEELVLNFFDH